MFLLSVQPKALILYVILWILSINLYAQGENIFAIRELKAKSGEKVTGFIEIPPLNDEGTQIPVTIIHGAKPGPIILLIAGVHGSEYAPIMALQKLSPQIDPKQVSGTIVMIHIANMPSFLKRTIYYGPSDWKNLNRVFPGKADGSLTERIAYTITHEFIDKATYVIDVHCGDANEALQPYVAYYANPSDTKALEQTCALASTIGIEHLKEIAFPSPFPAETLYLTRTAFARGKTVIAIECGELARTNNEVIATIEKGLLNALRYLKLLPGKVAPRQLTVRVDNGETLNSPVTGLFYPMVERGQQVKKGTPLGYITDFFGNRTHAVAAPAEGIVMFILGTPPVSNGEPLASMGYISSNTATK